MSATSSSAHALDQADALTGLRELFCVPRDRDGGERAYLCGNSLGLQPTSTAAALRQELDDWAALGVDGHFEANNPWYDYHEPLRAPLSRIVGALPHEVVAMNGLTVNLHLLLISFYRPTATRNRILTLAGAFPSDRYAVASHASLHGRDPRDVVVTVAAQPGAHAATTEDAIAAIEHHGEHLATVLLPGVHFYTGAALDIAAITAAGHRVGAMVGFDLAHAAGNLELALHDSGVDFAVWCSYKYLNSGPGSVGCAFVHERHAQAPDLPRLAGWWGNDPATRFAMPDTFVPQLGAAGWQLSNAPILTMAPLRAALAMFDKVGMAALRERSVRLTGYLHDRLDAIGGDRVTVITPRDPVRRGCQLSLLVPGRGPQVQRALAAAGVVSDYREPDVIRVAPVPMYNTFVDCERFAETVGAVLSA